MRLLVLGKSGQVGWELQRSLAPVGEVIALGRAEADLEQPAALADAIAGAAPAVIINACAYTAVDKAESEPDRAARINEAAVGELATMSAAMGAWVIHYSTDYVFDGGKSAPYVEEDPTSPRSVYGRTKRAGEVALEQSGAKHLIFRTSWVHAARGRNFIGTMLRLAGEREQLRVVADQVGAPTSAELVADVTALAIRAIQAGTPLPSGTYHLTAAGETSWHGLACFAIKEARGLGCAVRVRPDGIVPISTADYPTPATRPANSRLDTGKLRSALGITLPDWQVHVRRTVLEMCERYAG